MDMYISADTILKLVSITVRLTKYKTIVGHVFLLFSWHWQILVVMQYKQGAIC